MRAATPHPCPCGCPEIIDPKKTVGNIWHASDPYWAWSCSNTECPAAHREQKNQTGDNRCPWCHHKRMFMGHFQPPSKWGSYRTTVTGERVVVLRPESRWKEEIVFGQSDAV